MKYNYYYIYINIINLNNKIFYNYTYYAICSICSFREIIYLNIYTYYYIRITNFPHKLNVLGLRPHVIHTSIKQKPKTINNCIWLE